MRRTHPPPANQPPIAPTAAAGVQRLCGGDAACGTRTAPCALGQRFRRHQAAHPLCPYDRIGDGDGDSLCRPTATGASGRHHRHHRDCQPRCRCHQQGAGEQQHRTLQGLRTRPLCLGRSKTALRPSECAGQRHQLYGMVAPAVGTGSVRDARGCTGHCPQTARAGHPAVRLAPQRWQDLYARLCRHGGARGGGGVRYGDHRSQRV